MDVPFVFLLRLNFLHVFHLQADGAGDHLVRCRGLPWSITVSDVQSFFHDVKIRGEQSGIHLVTSVDGRPSGECFVEVMTEEDVGKAVAHSNENIGRRYVEVFSAKRAEMDWAFRDTPTTTKTEAIARLRGLPFGATKEEIAHFFSGENAYTFASMTMTHEDVHLASFSNWCLSRTC